MGNKINVIDSLLDPVEIPRMVDVRQTFNDFKIQSVEEEVRKQLHESGVLSTLKKGQTVAIATGSRGVADIHIIVKTIVSELKKIGTLPVIVPAMGSHGGGHADKQKKILEEMGVTEEYTGAPIRSSMETEKIGTSEGGLSVYIDKIAFNADATIIVNRIHPHVAFRGKFESGLMKMLAIGLGKLKGANICHDLGFGVMSENVADIGRACLVKGNILCGLAVIENAYHQIHTVKALRADEIEAEEPGLLELAKKLEPCLYIKEIDALIMDQIGKEISGSGFDTNIVGRYGTPYISGGPNVTKMSVLDVTDISDGNCIGIGMADFTTRKLFDKFSFENTYPNSLTATAQNGIKIPMVLKNDKQAVQAAIKCCNIADKNNVRMVWIKNTLAVDRISVSENLIPEVEANPNMAVLGEPYTMKFDNNGNRIQ